MKLSCPYCQNDVEVYIELSGPHLKASCKDCNKFIKFLNKDEKKCLEKEEDANSNS